MNNSRSFRSTCVIETRLSDFHIMAISLLKLHFCELSAKVISYRDFKKLENERFTISLQSTHSSQNIDYVKNTDQFFDICQKVPNHHALRKKVHAWE